MRHIPKLLTATAALLAAGIPMYGSSHREALAIREKVLGDQHPEVASSLSGLAYIAYQQSRYAGTGNSRGA